MAVKYQKPINKLKELQSNSFEEWKGVSNEDFIKEESQGKWSACQVFDHLYKVQLGTYMYMKKKLENGEGETTGLVHWIRGFILKYYLNSSKKFKAPSVLPDPENTKSLEEVKTQFEELNENINQLVLANASKMKGKAFFKHPVAGRLRNVDALQFLSWHWQHHLKQLERLKSNI